MDNEKLKKLDEWVREALEEPDGTPSDKRLIYTIVIVWVMGLISGRIGVEGLSNNVTDIIKTLIYASAGGYALGRFAESSKPGEKE